jgi:hypothetical protein
MSVLIRGDTTSFVAEVGDTVSQAADGSAEAHLTYHGTYENVSSKLPVPLQPHPTFPSLLLYSFDLKRTEGGLGSMSCVYRGILISNPLAYYQMEYQASMTSEPIETNKAFAYPRSAPPVSPTELAAINLALENNVPYTSSNTSAQLLYNKKILGIESYLRIGGTFSQSYVMGSIPSIPGTVGAIVSPPSGCPPAVATGGNYLYAGFSWRKSGGLVNVSETYNQSGPSGWDPDLYK